MLQASKQAGWGPERPRAVAPPDGGADDGGALARGVGSRLQPDAAFLRRGNRSCGVSSGSAPRVFEPLRDVRGSWGVVFARPVHREHLCGEPRVRARQRGIALGNVPDRGE